MGKEMSGYPSQIRIIPHFKRLIAWAHEGPKMKFISNVELCHSYHEQQGLKKGSDERMGHNNNKKNIIECFL